MLIQILQKNLKNLSFKHCTVNLLICGLSALLLMTQCTPPKQGYEEIIPLDPQISVEIQRMDHLFEQLDTSDLLRAYDSLRADYPAFCDLYRYQILNATQEDQLLQELQIYTQDPSYLSLADTLNKILEDLGDTEAAISQVIENYHSLFEVAEESRPQIYGFISGFIYQAFVFDDEDRTGIGLGLEMFLGSDFPYAQIRPADPAFSEYLLKNFKIEYIPRKIAEVLAEDLLPAPSSSDFLSLMMWGGKKLFVIDQLVNFAPDTIVTQYTREQLQWCRENEPQMWQYFFDNDLFYETDLKKFSKLIGPAPTSPGMPPQSPGETGNYMGWQIVRAYLNRNPEITITDLIHEQDAQKILDKSRYRPVLKR